MKATLIIFFLFSGILSFAQTDVFEKTVDFKNKRIDIDAELVDKIEVTNWAQDKVAVQVTYSINDGALNNLLEVSLDETASRIRLDVEFDDKKIDIDGFYDCDEERALTWGRKGERTRVCLDVKIEVKLPANAELDIESVIGDLFIEGYYKELHAKTVTGDIVLEWPEDQGAELEIKTVNGSIFTNHNFQPKQEKGLPLISAHEVAGNLGNGGKFVTLETVTSDIYFKRSK